MCKRVADQYFVSRKLNLVILSDPDFFFRVRFNKCGYLNKNTKIKERDALKESVPDFFAI